MARLEELRKELLREAYDTLARYDALLPSASPAPSSVKRTMTSVEGGGATAHEDDSDADPVTPGSTHRNSTKANGNRKPTSASGSPATHSFDSPMATGARQFVTRGSPIGRGRLRGRESGLSPRRQVLHRASSASLQDDSNASPSQPIIVATDTVRPNIHARTAGGRFAPKNSVGSPASARASPAASPRTPRSTPGNRTTAGEGSSNESPSRVRYRQHSPASSWMWPTLVATGTAKIGPSLAEIELKERKPKRVKPILGMAPPSPASASASSSNSNVDAAAAAAARSGAASSTSSQPSTPSRDVATAMEVDEVAPLTIPSQGSDALSELVGAVPSPSAQPTVDTSMDPPPGPPVSSSGPGAVAVAGAGAGAGAGASLSPSTREQPGVSRMPGRTAAARERAAAAIPSRRNSSRVKAISAFGERLPEMVQKREDFESALERAMGEALRSTSGASAGTATVPSTTPATPTVAATAAPIPDAGAGAIAPVPSSAGDTPSSA